MSYKEESGTDQGEEIYRPRQSVTAKTSRRGDTEEDLEDVKDERHAGNHNGGTIAGERVEDREREDIVSDRGSFSAGAAKSKQLRCCRFLHELVEIRPGART